MNNSTMSNAEKYDEYRKYQIEYFNYIDKVMPKECKRSKQLANQLFGNVHVVRKEIIK